MVVLQIALRIVRFQVFQSRGNGLLVCGLVTLGGLHIEIYVLAGLAGMSGFTGIIDVVDDLGRTVLFEFNHLLDGIVKHGGLIVVFVILIIIVFLYQILVGIGLFVRIVVCNHKFNLVKELARVQ